MHHAGGRSIVPGAKDLHVYIPITICCLGEVLDQMHRKELLTPVVGNCLV